LIECSLAIESISPVFAALLVDETAEERPKGPHCDQVHNKRDQEQCRHCADERGIVRVGSQKNWNAIGYRQNPLCDPIEHVAFNLPEFYVLRMIRLSRRLFGRAQRRFYGLHQYLVPVKATVALYLVGVLLERRHVDNAMAGPRLFARSHIARSARAVT
jgi:hypothetical protein